MHDLPKQHTNGPTDLGSSDFVHEVLHDMHKVQVHLRAGPELRYLSDLQPGSFASIEPILPPTLSRGSMHAGFADLH